MNRATICGLAVLFLLATAAICNAGWQLYDDFNTGTSFDSDKWEVDDSSAAVSLESGRAKFVHQPGMAEDSSNLYLIKNPESIAGIKATITMDSCSEGAEVRARLASFAGKLGENYALCANEIRSNRQYLSAILPLLGPSPDYVYLEDMFWGHFQSPLDIFGKSFTLSIIFDLHKAKYEVQGQGEFEFEFPAKLSLPDDKFKAIGTRSNTGSGSCTVYFDDVYVMRKSAPVAPGLLLLEQD